MSLCLLKGVRILITWPSKPTKPNRLIDVYFPPIAPPGVVVLLLYLDSNKNLFFK